jgi:enoyl-CoA hydratase
MSDQQDVLFDREGKLAIITLNRPKSLNALTLPMVRAIARALAEWAEDESVGAVLMRGAGERAFGAGGDIIAIHNAAKAHEAMPFIFFREEYELNLGIADYPKPIVAAMHGIVMGGGVGLSAHASHRIVSESSAIAMPEVGIGFLPDVGGTYLLSRAPGELGTHFALTGGRFGAADALSMNFADVFAPQASLETLPALLRDCATAQEVDAALAKIAAPAGPAPLEAERGWIDAAYAADSVEQIVKNLAARPEPAAAKALEAITRNSPTSLKITLRALRLARSFGRLKPCLDLEFVLAAHCMSSPDFFEGVRAAVIDKDRNPRWSPATLEETDESIVARFFE